MSRLSVELAGPVHRSSVRVLYADTDTAGVVYYANYLRFFELGRTELMRAWVVPAAELEAEGLILPVVECYCRYKASAAYDDLVHIDTCLAQIRDVACRFHYRLTREKDGRLLAVGFTLHAAVDRAGKLTRLPAGIVARLQAKCDQTATPLASSLDRAQEHG
ncbi:MAG: thioesterase family protein [Thermodesulfobacteriota bacterium]